MKKIYFLLLIVMAVVAYNNKSNQVIIPEEAIRFRVIANSNSKEDQMVKYLVRDAVEKVIVKDIEDSKSVEETRTILSNNVNKYKNLIANTLDNNNIKETFSVNYGMNYFPDKEYKGVKYKEGKYESLLITLGEGKGNNWWCCLFPPLCLIEAEEKETDEVEYKFFVKELLDKYLK